MLLRSLSTVGFWTLISRIFGFVREILISKYYGASIITDMFIIAIRIPGTAREFVSTGIGAAFIPKYGQLLENSIKTKTKSSLHDYSFLIIFWSCVFNLITVILAEIFMPNIIYYLAPGFRDDIFVTSEIIFLARIGFIYFFLLTIAGVIAGILATHGRYLAHAIAPAILNILIIVSILLFADKWPNSIFYLVVTFVIGGIVHLSYVLYDAWLNNILPKVRKIQFSDSIKKTAINSLPTMMATGVTQINTIISTALASTLPFGAISILFYTDRIIQLPVAIIGISLYTVLIPSLSRSLAKGNKAESNKNSKTTKALQNQGLSYALIFALPSSIAFYFLSKPIVYGIYVRGNFTPADGDLVATLLQTMAFALPLIIILRPLIAFHHAKQRYSIPLQASIISVSAHLVTSSLLISSFQHQGIIIGLVVSAWCNTIYQWLRLPKDIRNSFLKSAMTVTAKLLPALIMLGLMCYGANIILLKETGFMLLLYLFVLVSVISVLYLFYCYRFALLTKLV